MLKYLSIEILAKALYIKILHKEISKENDLNLSEIIKAIQRELNINFGILEELNEWRLIRNKIVHEHFKIGEKVAAKAKVFFSDSVKLLKRQLVN